jgi:two-component system cell cycle sensor histidine kinase/response regulator CckA
MAPDDSRGSSRPHDRPVDDARGAAAPSTGVPASLAATVAHDVNNMLTVVIGSIEHIGLQLPPTHPAVPDLVVARDAAQRAAGMTRRLLQATAPATLAATDANAVVASALTSLQRMLGSRIQLAHELAGDLWPAHADAEGLWQLLFNLGCNAREAMPDGGSLRIRTRNTTLTSHCVTATRTVVAGDYVAIEVTDTGTGMDQSVQQRMFEPRFSTRSGVGRGLGMAAVARIVQEARGGVRVRSEPGRGTTIEVLLPRSVV